MAMQVNSPGWRVRSATRGSAAGTSSFASLPSEYLTEDSRVSDEAVLDPAPVSRGAVSAGPVDLSVEVEPDQVALLAVRHPSGALTFHRPVESRTRGTRGSSQARFQVVVRSDGPTRGIIGKAVKAFVIKAVKLAGDKLVSLLLPKLVESFEKRSWAKHGLKEGWLHVTRQTLADEKLLAGTPISPKRSLLFIHGTFSNAVGGFSDLASTDFFDRVKDVYDDRIYAFNHFTLQRTPEENVRMLLEGLPEHTTTFDVITHSRGGLVLRTLVERARQFGALSNRFALGRAVLVAAPNNGTPLATPDRWDNTVGWLANLLEMFPDNPFTIGGEFVANGLVWIANHASGDIPGLNAMDGDGDPIKQLQTAAEPPAAAYSALVANYSPNTSLLKRLLDVGLDQFFGSANDLVVPSEGGWRVFRSSKFFIPGSRIGCFGPGGNLAGDDVTHVNFFGHQATADFLCNALEGRPQPLSTIDPRRALPDRRLSRGGPTVDAAAAAAAAPVAAAPRAGSRRRGPAPAAAALQVTVVNGDLSFEPNPLLIGHYASSTLTGTESVMNRLVGWTMDYSLQRGLYPVAPGSHMVFVNRHVDREQSEALIPRPSAVIVAGLGEEGALEAAELIKTVRLAVIAWARRVSEEPDAPKTFELASTLLASGGTGITAGQAADLIIQGVIQANQLIGIEQNQAKSAVVWPHCSKLRLIELYLDRAADAWRALQLRLLVKPNEFELTKIVESGKGGHKRPRDSGYRGAPYDFITVDSNTDDSGVRTFEFTLDSKRARSEVRGKTAQSKLLSELVATASSDENRDQRIGHTLSNLLVPIELEGYLAGTSGIQMALDPASAAIPWELLDLTRDESPDERPWAIRVKLLRKLKIDRFREHVIDARKDAYVLVVGEPACSEDFPRLEGARTEALCVADALKDLGEKITKLVADNPLATRPDAHTIVNALFEKEWRIVHIAGHGMPGEGKLPGGVVLSNGTFLGPDEIKSMRVVPELVFVNCCYLGQVGDLRRPKAYDRSRFASGVAGALIEIGVRCVIAAGWAVADDAASDFAATFYAAILRGERFIDAVGQARFAAWDQHRDVNTWAAYQCYGDPDWRFQPKPADANQARSDDREFANIATEVALDLELERIYVDTKFQGADRVTQVGKLQKLEHQFGPIWGNKGHIAEAFGVAYAEAGAMDRAISWYGRATTAADGSASMKAAEQLGNVESRFGWELVEKAVRHRDEMKTQLTNLGTGSTATREAKAAARDALKDAERRLASEVRTADALIDKSLQRLEDLQKMHPTMERQSLIASAIKRRVLVGGVALRARQVRRDLVTMRKIYAQAVQTGQKEQGAELHYPASNCLAADLVLAAPGKKVALDKKYLAITAAHVKARSGSNADFWSVVSGIELDQYQKIASRRLASAVRGLKRRYQDLHGRKRSTRMWSSVYDTACLVLSDYEQHASGKEEVAAKELLDLLRSYAHPGE